MPTALCPPGEQRGLEDHRGQLFNELVRLLQVCQPKMFLFENVPGLAGSRDEADGPMQLMLHAFAAAGYDVTWHLVNARGWVPQSRKRLYFVGFRSDLNVPPFAPPDAGGLATHRVRDILEPAESEAVELASISHEQWAKVQTPEFCAKSGRAAAAREILLDGVAPTLTSSCHTATSLSARFVFEEADGTRRTLPRFLTPRECARVMGFPDSFRFPPPERDGRHHHIYRQMGNAVVPPVIEAFAQAMLRALEAAPREPASKPSVDRDTL